MYMWLDKRTQPGWGDAVEYFNETDKTYGTAELKVQVVVKLQTDMTAATPLPTTSLELIQSLEIVPGQYEMPQVASRPGCT